MTQGPQQEGHAPQRHEAADGRQHNDVPGELELVAFVLGLVLQPVLRDAGALHAKCVEPVALDGKRDVDRAQSGLEEEAAL